MNQLNIFDQLKLIPPDKAKVFYNTIQLTGPDLKSAKDQTGGQNERILQIFREKRKLTPLAAHRAYCSRFPEIPVTSVRRSINTLTGLNLLKMLDKSHQVKESYGKVNNVWELV
jgi:hypothetical protein